MTRRPDQVGRASALRRGFTLVELVTAMAISSILFVALGSSILIASRAMPPVDDPTLSALNAGSASGVLADDLRYATAFSTLTATAVEFTVPDRTGDNSPEVIRYEWSGVAGAPLRRQMNGGTWTTVVSGVSAFALNYNAKTVSTTSPVTTTTTSPETLFSYFIGWPSVLLPTFTNTVTDQATWGAEFFTIDQVALPANVSSVQITRVRLMLKKVGTTGTVTVGIHSASGGGNADPAANPLGTPASVAVSSLPSIFWWVDVAMPADVSINQLNTEFVIVVKGTVSNCAQWQMLSSASAPNDSTPTGLWSSNAGSSWLPKNSSRYKNDLQFYAYGTYTTDSTVNVTTTTKYLQSVGVVMRPTGATNPTIATAVEVYAQPQVTLP